MVPGYLLGFLFDQFAKFLIRLLEVKVHYNETIAAILLGLLYAAGLIVFLGLLVRNFRTQQKIAQLVKVKPRRAVTFFGSLLLSLLVSSALIIGYLLLFFCWRHLTSLLNNFIWERVADILAWAVLLLLISFLFLFGVVRTLVKRVYQQASQRDRQVPAQVRQPQTPFRSGSPYSVESWDLTGREGKRFLSGGPRAADISRLTGQDALEPIRVYASLNQHGSTDKARAAAISELHRTGAFQRKNLLLAIPTGSGWVDEWNTQSVEFFTNGDCATIAVQYSYLPSWIAFCTELETVRQEASKMIAAIKTQLQQLPPDQRPKLYLTGESLGAYGGQQAFPSPQELLHQISGAVWIGTPGFTSLLEDLQAARHRGSPMIAPVVDSGRHFRFVPSPAQLKTDLYGRELGTWLFPRVVYAQHGSDPITAWHWRWLWHRPDWITERATRDTWPGLTWYRLVTFFQLTMDLAIAEAVPPGYGHKYEEELIPAWRAVLGVEESHGQLGGFSDQQLAAAIRNFLS